MGMVWKPEDATVVVDWATKATAPRPTYDGAVLGTFSRTERVMSDVWEDVRYARVWDGERVKDVAVWRSATTVDATTEVLAKALAWWEADAGEAWARELDRVRSRIVDAAMTVAKDKAVTVVAGRKVPKGTKGVVFWVGAGKFGMRAGLLDAEGTVHWTALSNLAVDHPEEYMEVPTDYPPTAAAKAAAGERALAAKVTELSAGRWAAADPDFWLVAAARADFAAYVKGAA